MGSEPVVVQGTPVQPSGGGGFAGALNSNNGGGGGDYGDQRNAYGAAANTAVATPMTGDIQNNENRGEKQEVKCRDPIFAVLFYANIVAILVVAIIYGPDALQTDDDNAQENQDYEGYVYASLIMAFVSFFASAGGLAIMMCIPETLIKVALISTVVLAGVWMVIAFLTGNIGLGIIGLIFFAITCCYAYFVWSRIPFATINLVTAMRAVTRNAGVIGFAYIITAVAAGWCICWTVAFVGVFDKTYECDENGENCDNPNYGYLFLLFLAFFFGQQVLQNTVHVVTAGTVGHWWFEPSEAQGCCSAAVVGSFIRATTTSFGSICFGSFIVAVIRALEALVHTARAQGDGNECLLCVIECLLSCIGNLVEYFNKWAFIYVGLYGYGYLEAGKSVITLLRNRGWEAIIADDLVNNTLLLVSVLVGCVVGCIGLVVESTSDLFDDAGGDAKAVSFFLGLLIGLFIASVALSTIASGVNAVIVLFAEAPADFQRNHPDLSEKMRTIWAQTYPGSI
eukprot:CAMPEP_0198137520 /NCGR_PEP_ID=MMETSP1443-20131203/992_1 /TAXON_ID=186043 /ORGANISM="Entomoneis sp., Strain CCMP2396" /LENGTH=509 /DNA_ID=CAMNT_0043798973 /DNA_START=99 /DNA_END=1628 /DNA_ORIENTATION=+